jgi:hypothetical protein
MNTVGGSKRICTVPLERLWPRCNACSSDRGGGVGGMASRRKYGTYSLASAIYQQCAASIGPLIKFSPLVGCMNSAG